MSDIIIPENIRYDPEVPPLAALIYGELMLRCESFGGETKVTDRALAELYRRDVRTVNKTVALLCERGYFRVEHDGSRRRLVAQGRRHSYRCRTEL